MWRTTFASDGDNLARRACNPSVKPISYLLARRTLGADGKDYRANSVHAPFPENQHPSAPLRSVVRRLPACENRLRSTPRGT